MKLLPIFAFLVIFLLLVSGCISITPKRNFLHDSEAKITIRELANPIADIGSFDTLVSSVINENPFGCTAYTTDGQRHAPVEKVKEIYTARLVYEDADANVVGTSENDFNTVSGFNSGIAIIMANTALANAYGGICIHDPDADTYYAALRCHDANGELYYLALRRDSVTLVAYSDDAIRARFEAWADKIPSLAQAGGGKSRNPTSLKTNFSLPQIS
ncbi:MAG: hypothetical protein NTW33_01635 [Methanoregula sp.]|nr:hypothetical protein [Methanoregula sp.]